MVTLLVTNIHTLVTMDDGQREIRRGALWVRDNVIEQVGRAEELPDTADEVLDLGDLASSSTQMPPKTIRGR